MWPVSRPDEADVPTTHAVFDDDGRIVLSLGGFVVRIGERVLLVDAGAGPLGDVGEAVEALDRSWVEHGGLLDDLRAGGLAPEDVTDVVFTHLHFDHIGWASQAGQPTFPNATYRCDRRDADCFLGPDAMDETMFRLRWGAMSARDRLAPVLDRLETWDRDGSIAPGVDVRRTPGHTPGSSVVVVSSGTARALILGDVVHCPLELTSPDWEAMADMDQALARTTRAALLREVNGDDLVGAPHFPGLEFGRLLPGEGARQWLVSSR
ncbi:MAG: MBL fold metallo-hydrolase [Acidobacteria bacterium]|nr:MBL fold metallo-hydrolase [Acidobacteriota bacterium]